MFKIFENIIEGFKNRRRKNRRRKNRIKQKINRNKLLKQQMANANALQKTIDEIEVSCSKGTECYFQKQSTKLETIMREKEINKDTAPEQFFKARENYYTFTEGNNGFIKKEEDRLSLIADEMIGTLTTTHQDTVNNINITIDKYNYAVKYQDKLISEIKILIKDDAKLSKSIANEIAELKTADRKIYYENNEIETLELWVKVLTVLYWLIFAIFAGLFLLRSLWKDKKYIVTLVVLILWPFISNWIINNVIKFSYYLLPKNVYIDAANM